MNNVDKVMASAADAVADIPEGASLAVGGFGLCGIPTVLIDACTRRAPAACVWSPTTAALTARGSASC